MAISRRKFLMAGSAVALAAGFPLKNALTSAKQQTIDAPPSSQQNSAKGGAGTLSNARAGGLATFTKATFAAQVNTTFRIQSKPAKPADVRLIEVKDVGPIPDQRLSGKECFSLVFRGQPGLRQSTYMIEHAALGKFALLLVPIGQDRKGSYYEAVINRLNS
jgi:uncharacterized protein DUF6916